MWKAKSTIKTGDAIKFIYKHCVRRARCSENINGIANHSCNKNKYLKSIYDIPEKKEYTPEYPFGSSVEPFDVAREEELLNKDN